MSLATSLVLTVIWEHDWLSSLITIALIGGVSGILIFILQSMDELPSVVESSVMHGDSTILYGLCWWWVGTVLKSESVLGKSATKGEWTVVSSAVSLVVVNFFRTAVDTNSTSTSNLHSLTAASGVIGCSLSCFLGTKLFKQNVLMFLLFVAVATLACIELCFHGQLSTSVYRFPRCLFWIFGDFFWVTEESKTEIPGFASDFPRFGWLGYWLVVLLVAIPLAPSPSSSNPVIARKWFHLVAVVLFLPTTMVAPQMQSLSYAVALCVLLVIESSRCHLPWLNDFYRCYLDTSKLETEDHTVVSHMGLICGCAIPLWIHQWLGAESHSNPMLLPLAGVWTLGVGDAVGAVIGSTFGQYKWGQQNRTIEGSVAMFVSLCTVMYPQEVALEVWLPTAVIVTLLEAFTLQIDNIVLPLVASMTMILWSS